MGLKNPFLKMSGSQDRGNLYYKDKNVAKSYDKLRFSSLGGRYIRQTERRIFLDLLGDIEGKKILDMATGTGRLAIDMAERGGKVTGVDVSGEMLEIARGKVCDRELEIGFIKSDVKNLGFKDKSFDIITASRFLHVIDDLNPYLREITRVGREKLVCDFFSVKSLRILYNWALPMDSTLRSMDDVKTAMIKFGIKNIRTEKLFLIPYGLLRIADGEIGNFLANLDRRLSKDNDMTKILGSVIYLSGDLS